MIKEISFIFIFSFILKDIIYLSMTFRGRRDNNHDLLASLKLLRGTLA